MNTLDNEIGITEEKRIQFYDLVERERGHRIRKQFFVEKSSKKEEHLQKER